MYVTLLRSLEPAEATADETELPAVLAGFPVIGQLVCRNRALS